MMLFFDITNIANFFLQEDIKKMPREKIEVLLFRTLERRPGMLFNLLEAPPPPPPPPPPCWLWTWPLL